MENEKLYTLISLEDFKAVLGVDDREDKLAKFCLVTSTLTIEQYCKRRFLHNIICSLLPIYVLGRKCSFCLQKNGKKEK